MNMVNKVFAKRAGRIEAHPSGCIYAYISSHKSDSSVMVFRLFIWAVQPIEAEVLSGAAYASSNIYALS